MPTAADFEQALGLSDATPSETDMLFPDHGLDLELLDGSTVHLKIKPWGLGRFCQAQTIIADLISSTSQLLSGVDPDKIADTLTKQSLLRVLNLLMPHARDLLVITLGAKGTFEKQPDNIRQFVDELPLAASVQITTIVLRQNWRHLKNVLGLAEVSKLRELISARQPST